MRIESRTIGVRTIEEVSDRRGDAIHDLLDGGGGE